MPNHDDRYGRGFNPPNNSAFDTEQSLENPSALEDTSESRPSLTEMMRQRETNQSSAISPGTNSDKPAPPKIPTLKSKGVNFAALIGQARKNLNPDPKTRGGTLRLDLEKARAEIDRAHEEIEKNEGRTRQQLVEEVVGELSSREHQQPPGFRAPSHKKTEAIYGFRPEPPASRQTPNPPTPQASQPPQRSLGNTSPLGRDNRSSQRPSPPPTTRKTRTEKSMIRRINELASSDLVERSRSDGQRGTSGILRLPDNVILDAIAQGEPGPYRIRVDDLEYGPTSEAVIVKLIRAGYVTGADEIATGRGGWERLERHRLFINFLERPFDEFLEEDSKIHVPALDDESIDARWRSSQPAALQPNDLVSQDGDVARERTSLDLPTFSKDAKHFDSREPTEVESPSLQSPHAQRKNGGFTEVSVSDIAFEIANAQDNASPGGQTLTPARFNSGAGESPYSNNSPENPPSEKTHVGKAFSEDDDEFNPDSDNRGPSTRQIETNVEEQQPVEQPYVPQESPQSPATQQPSPEDVAPQPEQHPAPVNAPLESTMRTQRTTAPNFINEQSEAADGKSSKIMVVVILILLLLVAGGIVYAIMSQPEESPQPAIATNDTPTVENTEALPPVDKQPEQPESTNSNDNVLPPADNVAEKDNDELAQEDSLANDNEPSAPSDADEQQPSNDEQPAVAEDEPSNDEQPAVAEDEPSNDEQPAVAENEPSENEPLQDNTDYLGPSDSSSLRRQRLDLMAQLRDRQDDETLKSKFENLVAQQAKNPPEQTEIAAEWGKFKKVGSNPTVFQTKDPSGRVWEFTPEHKSGPSWRGDYAFYQLCGLIDCGFSVPESRLAFVSVENLKQLAGDSEARRFPIHDKMVSGVLREVISNTEPLQIEDTGIWRNWLSHRTPMASLRKTMLPQDFTGGNIETRDQLVKTGATIADVAQAFANILAADYLTNNFGRFARHRSQYGENVRFLVKTPLNVFAINNQDAFQARESTRVRGRFNWSERVGKNFVESLRRLKPDYVEAILFPDISHSEKVSMGVFWEQRSDLLNQVDNRVKSHGADEILF